jgi:hypothetical protein
MNQYRMITYADYDRIENVEAGSEKKGVTTYEMVFIPQ